MTKARIKCRRCREWFQYDIKKERATCPNVKCGFIMNTTMTGGFDGPRKEDVGLQWQKK